MILCCGEALIDMIRVPVPGAGEAFVPVPGGSLYNTAIAIGRLGAPVQFLGRMSTDFFGEILIQRLRENGVGDDLIIRCDRNTSLAFVQAGEGRGPQYIFYTEGAADRSLSIEDMPAALPGDTHCVVFGSISMTMEPVASAIESLIVNITDNEAPVLSFDPNIRPLLIKNREAYTARFEKWAAASTICKMSSEDIAFVYPYMKPEHALRELLNLGVRLAICTLGEQGVLAMFCGKDENIININIPGIALPVVDTVGAGDTFHGALLSWLELRGKMSRSAIAALSEAELREALVFANHAAAIVCSRRGAEPPTMEELRIIDKTVIQR